MRVLLISPLDPEKPTNLKLLMGGENTYTRTLLQHPPHNVQFIHYEEALTKGLISYHFLYYPLLWLQKLKILPTGLRIQVIYLRHTFDLIYAHGYPLKIMAEKVPLIISDSSSNYIFWEKYLGWPKWRLGVSRWVKYFTFKLLGAIDGEVNTNRSTAFFVFSKWASRVKRKLKVDVPRVIYPGLPLPKLMRKVVLNDSIRFLFVGVWFERKGGRILLKAFRRLAKRYQNIELTIFGQLPSDISIDQKEPISHKEFTAYDELLRQYRTHDVLVHVPPEIEGYGMTVVEAMSYGLIPVVSNVCALPEFVEQGKSGLIVKAGSVVSLENSLARLITNKRLRQRLVRGVRQHFSRQFALALFHRKLLNLFEEARR